MSVADITPEIPAGRQIIQSYGDGRFRIAGQVHTGSVLVTAGETRPWPVADVSGVSAESLAPVIEADDVDILLLGCGPRFLPAPAGLAAAVRASGTVLEWMDTGAACRTFNLLVGESRRVAALLLPA